MANWPFYCCLCLGFASALVAGVFQSFSDFVMAGLVRARAAGGIESMQHINRTVFRSVFLTSFLLLVPLTVAFALYAAVEMQRLARVLVIVASVMYITAVFLVTILGNVPMNKYLDKLDYTSSEAVDYWRIYSRKWTRWNHVRTIGSASTAALFLLAAASLNIVS